MRCGWRGRGTVLALLLGSVALSPAGCGDSAGPAYAPLVVTTTSLPNAVETRLYSEALVATGGDSVYEWSVPAGALPAGLSLTPSSGLISGTPGTQGSFSFTARVTSGDGQIGTRQLSITVEPPVLQPSELCSDYPDDAIATFEDAAITAAVRAEFYLGAGEDLTCGLVSQLWVLEVDDAGITSLVGLQNATELRSLWLSGNSISDISPLSGLTSLTVLYLNGNSISDISALSELASLQYLQLGLNSISDISPLSGLTNLLSLDLFRDSISDISPLSGLTSLMYLTLWGNSISDITPLSRLTNLRYLLVHENAIGNISALAGLTELTRLWLARNSITDISPLNGLTNVADLNLSQNSIGDISALSALTGLSELMLSGNPLGDISPLSGLTGLTFLELGFTSLRDISPLSGLTSLMYLTLSGNSITDIRALSGLTDLRQIELSSNPDLADIQPLLDNPGLGAGDYAEFWSTSVSCADVAALQAKGVTVNSDCP